MNDQNFVLSVLTLEELGATGNKGLSGVMTNPVLQDGLAGLATSATAQATVEVSICLLCLLGTTPGMQLLVWASTSSAALSAAVLTACYQSLSLLTLQLAGRTLLSVVVWSGGGFVLHTQKLGTNKLLQSCCSVCTAAFPALAAAQHHHCALRRDRTAGVCSHLCCS